MAIVKSCSTTNGLTSIVVELDEESKVIYPRAAGKVNKALEEQCKAWHGKKLDPQWALRQLTRIMQPKRIHTMANEIIIQETTHVSKQLCLDYIKSQNTNLTEGEQAQYIAVAVALNLNPFLHEIYPIKYGKDPKMTLVTGYQVYIRRAEEFPQYDGFDTTFEGVGKDLCCVCNVYRKDRTRPVTARVFLNEYHQGNTMWNTKPHVMLEKVAIGTAFRRAFPSEFNGMPYTTEEVDYVSSDESMKAKGFTKVEAEAENPKTEKYLPLYDKMMGRLAEMDNENKVAADAVRAQIKKEGVKKSTVTTETLENIEHWYETACKLSSSVSEEYEEVQ